MLPMANRLQAALDSANFNYTEEEFEKDIYVIENIDEVEEDKDKEKTIEPQDVKSKIIGNEKKLGENISGLFGNSLNLSGNLTIK